MMMAAEGEISSIRLDVPGNVKGLLFLHDRLNPALPSNTKDVRTMMVGIGGKSICLYAVLPDRTSLTIASLDISTLKQCLPSDYLGRGAFLSGLLGRFGSPPSDLRVYPALTGADREGLLISGCIDGDVIFWYWSPWSRHGILPFIDTEEDDGEDEEVGSVQFLCRGPTELDTIFTASLVQLQNEKRRGLSLLLVSPLGSVYSLGLDEVPCSAQWTCQESSEDPISDVRIDRYDHETISVALSRPSSISLLMFGTNGLVDLGSIRCSGEKIKLSFWKEDQYSCLLGDELVGVSVADGKAERIWSHRLPNHPIWTVYSDEALEADAIICGLGFGVVEFFSVQSSSLDALLRSEHVLPQGHVTDLMMEPSMQVKVIISLNSAHAIFTLPNLMKLQSWTDTAVKYPVKIEFARWFDLMSPFSYSTGHEHGRLCIDELLGAELARMYPPRSWSDLGRLVESLPCDDTRSFLYLLLDAKQDPARISSFCRRYSVDGYHLHLVRALHSFDLGAPAAALHHLVLALRSESILLESSLSLLLSKIVPAALMDEPALLVLANRLVGSRVALGEEAYISALLKLGKYSQALQYARDQDLVASLLDRLPSCSLSRLALTGEEQAHLTLHSLTLYQLARGNTAGAIEAFEAWRSSGVSLDDPDLAKLIPSMQHFAKTRLTSATVPSRPIEANTPSKRTPTRSTPTKRTPAPIPTGLAPVSPLKPILPEPTALTPVTPPPKLSLRSSPGPTATSSPTSSPTASGSSPKTGCSTSSPPLRSVLPRHVPANQPSRLANLVEYEEERMGMMMSGEGLEANLFTRALLDDMEEVGPSSSEYEMSEAEMSGAESTATSPRRATKASPVKSPKTNASPKKTMSPKKSASPKKDHKSPTKETSSSPTKASLSQTSPSKSTTSTTSNTSHGSPRRYNLRDLPPIKYPSSAPSPRRHHRPRSPLASLGTAEETKFVPSTPKNLKTKAAETKSQFKKRIREDLALPSPIVKRSRADNDGATAASPRKKSPLKAGTPTKGGIPTTPTRMPTRSRSKLVTPSISRTAEDGTETPPVRATPPAVLRRGRR